MLPDAAVAGPATVNAMSEPAVIVVVSVTSLFAALTSGASVGTRAPMTTLPCTVVRRPALSVALPLSASGGTEHVTVVAPAAGSGAHPVIVPDVVSSVVPAGTISCKVFAGAASNPLFVTVTW